MKNQFRALDDDEVEFLDSVMEKEREKEVAVRKQTAEELDAFRKQQEEAEKAAKASGSEAAPATDDSSWAVGKKRKKGREGLLGGVKLRKASSGDKASVAPERETGASPPMPKEEPPKVAGDTKVSQTDGPSAAASKAETAPTSTSGIGLGLAAYSSDEDD